MKLPLGLLVLLILANGCRTAQPQGQPPSSSLGAAGVEIFRPAGATAFLGSDILAWLENQGLLDHRVNSSGISASQDGMDIKASAFSLDVTLRALEFLPEKQHWAARLEFEISDPLLDLEFSSGGQVLGTCQALLSVPGRKCSLSFYPEGQQLQWRLQEPCTGQPPTIELGAYCPGMAGDIFCRGVEESIGKMFEEALEKTAQLVATALRDRLGLGWQLRLALQSEHAPSGWAQIALTPIAMAELGENGSRAVFSAAAWSQSGGQCSADQGDLAGVEPPALESKLIWSEETDHRLLALALSDAFLEQLVQALWRSGLLCPEEIIPLADKIRLEDFMPSLAAWEPRQGALLIRAPQPPLCTLLTDAGDQSVLSAVTFWPEVYFDIYSGCFSGRCRALGLRGGLKLEFQAAMAENSFSLRLKNLSLENPALLFELMLAESESAAIEAGRQIIYRTLSDALQEFSLPLVIAPGNWHTVRLKRLAGRSIWYLKAAE